MILRDGLLVVLITTIWYSEKTTGSDLIAAFPGIYRPGSPVIVTCNLLKYGQKTVHLALGRNGVNVLQNSSVVTYGTPNHVMINVPLSVSSSDITEAKLTFSGGSIKSSIKFDSTTSVALIQTDRGMYAEKEDVKLRVVVLLPSLKPYTGRFNIEIFDGKNKTVKQWLDVRGKKGVYSRNFQIPKNSNNGHWRIVVEIMKRKTEKEFEVRKYVVPKFKVQINCPTFYTRSTRNLRCKIKARYFFGKPVSGVIRLQYVTKIRNTNLFLSDDAADITGEFTKSTPLKSSTMIYENDIEVVAKVSDPSTGSTVINSVIVKLKRDGKMKWTLEPKRNDFQPGLPFVTFLKFQNLKTSTMPVKVKIIEKKLKTCHHVYKYVVFTNQWISTSLNVDNQGYGKLSLTPSNYASELNIMTYHGADKASETLYASRRNRGLVILPRNPFTVIGDVASFDITTKKRVTGPLWYIISSRGTELKHGRFGQGTHSKFTCSFNIEPNFYPGIQLLIYHATQNGKFSEDSIFIPVKGNPTNNFVSISTHQRSCNPGETLRFTVNSTRNSVVYLLTIDEGIHRSQHGFDINIDDVNVALSGIVSQFQNIKMLGGISTPTDTSGYPTSCKDLCADKPCKNGGTCSMKSDSRYTCLCPSSFSGNRCQKQRKKTNSVLQKQGWLWGGSTHKIVFAVVSSPNIESSSNTESSPNTESWNTVPVNRIHPSFPPSRFPLYEPHKQHQKKTQSIAKVEPIRRNFPRTWIWEEIHMRGRKLTSFTKKVPDTLTTWITTAFCVNDDKGFGISQGNNPLKIQVFQSFFVKIKPPSDVVAGNSVAIQISLFNYHPTAKIAVLYVWFQDSVGGSFVKVNGRNSTLKMQVIDTNLEKFGFYNITVAVYDFLAGYKILDSAEIPIFVKAPGVQQDYNVPKIISLNGRSSWIKDTINISLPSTALPKTEFLFITITGDILAPSINGLDHLIRSPSGCGEQTMMYLAPNIYVIHYLKSTKQLSTDMKRKAVTNINSGVDRELRWRRHDGSFSVWGNRDRHGSTWLTSFVMMCFHQADDFIPVEKGIFVKGLNWLLRQQNTDGSFAENGRVIQYQMQGGVRASRVTMTAYVLLTLLEFKDFSEFKTKIATAKTKAMQYITRSSNINGLRGSKHGMALTSYVLQKAGYSDKAKLVYADLKTQANFQGKYLFWQNNGNRVYKQKLSWQSPNPRARPIDIETSAYALLYLAEKKDMSQGIKIVNWLVSQRNPQGGYSSTQDTVVSLHALAKFSSLLQQSSVDAEVKVKTDFKEKTVHVNRKNRLLVQRIELDKRTKHVEIKVKGKGLVLVDTTVKYNVMKSGDSTFEINTTISSSKQTFDKITVNVCIRRKDNKDNGMVVAEVGLPCGFKGDLSKTNARGLDHKEAMSDKLVLYFKNLRRNWVCFDVTGNRVDKVTESQGVPIIVYDYYEPENYGIASYLTGKLQEMNICQICPECNICKEIVLG